MPGWEIWRLYRSTPDAFNYGNEIIEKAYTWGFRASIDLSPGFDFYWYSVENTIQFAGTLFAKSSIQPELVNGQLQYLVKPYLELLIFLPMKWLLRQQLETLFQ